MTIFIMSWDIIQTYTKEHFCWERESIPMNRWIGWIKWITPLCLRKKPFTAVLPWQTFQMLTTVIHRMCGRPLAWKPWEITMISIWKQMSFSWQIALKILEIHTFKIIVWTQLITTQHQDYHGIQDWKWLKLNWKPLVTLTCSSWL